MFYVTWLAGPLLGEGPYDDKKIEEIMREATQKTVECALKLRAKESAAN